MKCMEIRQNKLFIADRNNPSLGKGEVLIKIHAAGVSRHDINQRKYTGDDLYGKPEVSGMEVAGEVVEIARGANSRRGGLKPLRKKDKVIALVKGGGYGEYCVAPAEQCLHMPNDLDFMEAAAIPVNFFAAWNALVRVAKVKKGQTVLMHGGASGLGTTVIQIAKYLGARIIVTAGSSDRCKQCEKLGADFTINYKDHDFVEKTRKLTKNQGIDAVLDIVGGEYFARNISLLKTGGIYVGLDTLIHGAETNLNMNEIMEKEIVVTGTSIFNLPSSEIGKIAHDVYKNLWPLMRKKSMFTRIFGKKRIMPVIDNQFLMTDAQTAHDYMDRGIHFGKVVLRII